MIKTNNGGLAFPLYVPPDALDGSFARGMSLRDFFAGQALAGLVAGVSTDPICRREMFEGDVEWGTVTAYKLADAMLAERAKP